MNIILADKDFVYVISDSVGETAELVVKAVVSQFNGSNIQIKRYANVMDQDEVDEVINEAKQHDAIIAYTIVVPKLKQYIDERAEVENVLAIDLLNPLISAFKSNFNKEPKYEPKLIRQLDEDYFRKIAAIEFAVKFDDGRDPRGIKEADIVLVGVSRTSKTPLSMYLAHRGYKVANVPLVPEVAPPEELFEVPRNKCVGLIILPENLNKIRKERLRHLGLTFGANYASFERILEELEYAERIMKRIGCPIIDVSNKAIEETAEYILTLLKERIF